jgi:hypothetical protein
VPHSPALDTSWVLQPRRATRNRYSSDEGGVGRSADKWERVCAILQRFKHHSKQSHSDASFGHHEAHSSVRPLSPTRVRGGMYASDGSHNTAGGSAAGVRGSCAAVHRGHRNMLHARGAALRAAAAGTGACDGRRRC